MIRSKLEHWLIWRENGLRNKSQFSYQIRIEQQQWKLSKTKQKTSKKEKFDNINKEYV